jgi:UDP-N-acetylglucosamine acyltransferase
MPDIHPTAIVAPGAVLGDGVSVGPFCTVGPRVTIGAGTRLVSHVVLDGALSLGRNCEVFPFASLGLRTQDKKHDGSMARTQIGDDCVIREYVTVNAATYEAGLTRVGDRTLIMAYCHVAHDCDVGNDVVMANAATLAGHVVVEDFAIIGGLTGVHQFVRVGRMSITGGCSKIGQDVPPYTMADGNPLQIHGLNVVGLRRRGIPSEEQNRLKEMFRILYRMDLATNQAVERILETHPFEGVVAEMVSFIRCSDRGITK